MSASVRIKSAVATALHAAGMQSRDLRRRGRDVAILMYHRVVPGREAGLDIQAGMLVEPDTLDSHIRVLRQHFDIVPLSDLKPGGHGKMQGSRRKPRCVLTFDDGWWDFYRFAYPILSRHGAPATVFLPTDFIGTDRWFWTDRVGDLLERMRMLGHRSAPASRSGDELIVAIAGLSGNRAARLERAIELLKPHGVERIERVLQELAALAGGGAAPAGRAFITWDEAREMAASGLVTFGSHTAGHLLLTTLTEAQARQELRKSMVELISRQAAAPSFIPFCYPNGAHTRRLSEIVRETGYHLAVTTRHGWHAAESDPFMIPRIALHQDIAATEPMLLARIAGFW